MSSFDVALQPKLELFCLLAFDFADAPLYFEASLCHLLSRRNQSGNDRTWAAAKRFRNPATTKRDHLFDPTNVVSDPHQ